MTHSNGLMTNHKFINIEEDKEEMLEVETLCQNIASNLDLKKFEANLNFEDKAKNGLLTYSKVKLYKRNFSFKFAII
jgi:hypothetical protein